MFVYRHAWRSFVFIAPDTDPKKLIVAVAWMAAMQCSNAQGGARAGPSGIGPRAMRMPGCIRAGENDAA
jgi:hypothetical protein